MGASDGVDKPGAGEQRSQASTVQSGQQQIGIYPQVAVPQSQAGAMVAPGGFHVYNPSMPPAELPTPFIDVQQSGFCKPQGQQQAACRPGQQYDHTAVAIGKPVQHSFSTSQQDDQHCCRCTLGWALYGLGWVFALCWVAAIILPFITKDPADKKAAIASGVTMVAITVAVVIAVVAITATAVRE